MRSNYDGKTTLVIMAAGIGSRFGTGIKQLAKMSSNGEIIMDYSIFDAKEAGFNRVVFIIRKDIEDEFKAVIGDRIAKHIDVEYVFQELSDLPEGFSVPEGRKKPWGTGQAVLSCKGIVKEPFVMINADDYYGKEAFVKLHHFLLDRKSDAERAANTKYHFGMAGFVLKNTLSEHGTVTRGVCNVDENDMLVDIVETHKIQRMEDGTIICEEPHVQEYIQEDSKVSMNMWAAYPEFLDYLEELFVEFLADETRDAMTKEYLIPSIIGKMLKDKIATVKVSETKDKWIGITYKEDMEAAKDGFAEMIREGKYAQNLWE